MWLTCYLTALIVRYLTGRFIGEYYSGNDMIYQHSFPYFGSLSTSYDIIDASDWRQTRDANLLKWGDRSGAFVVVYSLTDASSLATAEEILQQLPRLAPKFLVANKLDLQHRRQVHPPPHPPAFNSANQCVICLFVFFLCWCRWRRRKVRRWPTSTDAVSASLPPRRTKYRPSSASSTNWFGSCWDRAFTWRCCPDCSGPSCPKRPLAGSRRSPKRRPRPPRRRRRPCLPAGVQFSCPTRYGFWKSDLYIFNKKKCHCVVWYLHCDNGRTYLFEPLYREYSTCFMYKANLIYNWSSQYTFEFFINNRIINVGESIDCYVSECNNMADMLSAVITRKF